MTSDESLEGKLRKIKGKAENVSDESIRRELLEEISGLRSDYESRIKEYESEISRLKQKINGDSRKEEKLIISAVEGKLRRIKSASSQKPLEDEILTINGKEIYKGQYEALQEFAKQYGTTAEELLKYRKPISLKEKYVSEIDLVRKSIKTPDKTLNVPDGLIKLSRLDIPVNNLSGIHIPDTLTNLERLEFQYNQLTEIYIPGTLIELKVICCHSNPLNKSTKKHLRELTQRGIGVYGI